MVGRPKGIRVSAVEKASGYGRPGYCKLCAWPGAQFLNAKIVRDPELSAAKALAWAREMDPDFRFDRHVFYNHKSDHLTSPLVSVSDMTRKTGPKILPKNNREALERIRDIGMDNAIEHPETITVDHAIRAMDVMEKKSSGPEGLWVLLSKVQAGMDPTLLAGEYTELPLLETKEAVEEAQVQ